MTATAPLIDQPRREAVLAAICLAKREVSSGPVMACEG